MKNLDKYTLIANITILFGFIKFAIDLYRYVVLQVAKPADLIIATGMILLGYALNHRECNIDMQRI